MKKFPFFCSVAIVSLMSSQARAHVTFIFDYSGTTDFDATSTASLEDAAATVGSWFNHTADITMAVTSTNDAASTNLASAGSNYVGSGAAGFGNSGVVANKIFTGVDSNGSAADGVVNVNFAQPWDFDDDIDANFYDFKSTAIHELLHAVGFASSIQYSGLDQYGGTDTTDPGYWEIFDKYVADKNGAIINGATYVLDQARWDAAKVGGTPDGLFFNGPNAMAGNGGNPVPLYSPSNPSATDGLGGWEGGSSGSHTDDEYYLAGGQNLLMGAATGTGAGSRTMTSMERGMLLDLGYSLTPVPEPSSALLFSVGTLALLARRRRA